MLVGWKKTHVKDKSTPRQLTAEKNRIDGS